MALKRLWAPWRATYVKSVGEAAGSCVFCAARDAADDAEALLVRRGMEAFVLLNKYPYGSGHLMVAPRRHVADFRELSAVEAAEIHALTAAALSVLERTLQPQGFNLGWNLGRVAGAGIVDHIHLHVVPRWAGDTNFMPVLADTKVVSVPLGETRTALASAWPT